MRLLFKIDTRDYDTNGNAFTRPSVRSIIIRDGKVGMVHSQKYHYYKFPGGGIKFGESQTETLIRETREEAGLLIIPDSIREYGYVYRIQKGKHEAVFAQENYYYICDAASEVVPQQLDDYEAKEQFTLEFVSPQTAIAVYRNEEHGRTDQIMLEREAHVLELLIQDGHLKKD